MLNHIEFDPQNMRLILLDQRKLPHSREFAICETCADVMEAIKNMTIRGAPAIGIAAAYACLLALRENGDFPDWKERLNKQLTLLAKSRPTAVNLAWAVSQMRAEMAKADSADDLATRWLGKAREIHEADQAACRAIGKAGQELLKDGDTVLTHCNAGALATGGYGTALGVIRAAVENGKRIAVIADETRPLLQGSRLTAWELRESGIPVTIACDNAAAMLMAKGKVNAVITGADRIAANGDSANKIGTLGLAIMANYYRIPFYIAAPISTLDFDCQDGSRIVIEERSPEEVTNIGGASIAPAGVPACNFAFDVTPASLIKGIITEKGILRPPFDESIHNMRAEVCQR